MTDTQSQEEGDPVTVGVSLGLRGGVELVRVWSFWNEEQGR